MMSFYPQARHAGLGPTAARRILTAAALAICTACLPGPLWSQPWLNGTNGSIYYNGGNVGIGTAYPATPLHVYNGTTDSLISIQTGALPHYEAALVLTSNKSWTIASQGDWMYTNGALLFRNNTDGVNAMTVTSSGSVGIGTTYPQHLLQVAGTIGAQEVLVTSTGADYVFRPDYRLQPLSEVDSYIQANHHLPDIPSEDEVKQKGIGVGEMEAKLLAKIEELTLHMIRQEKENQELRNRIARLEAGDARR